MTRLVFNFLANQSFDSHKYPLSTIDEIMYVVSGFVFASVIDLNMGYLSIPLCAELRRILMIVTHFRFFKSCIFPMGIKSASDIFQSCMVGVFHPMKKGRLKSYIDDIFHGNGNAFNEHLMILNEIS